MLLAVLLPDLGAEKHGLRHHARTSVPPARGEVGTTRIFATAVLQAKQLRPFQHGSFSKSRRYCERQARPRLPPIASTQDREPPRLRQERSRPPIGQAGGCRYRTPKFTAAPTVTFSPGAGFCETIMLPGDGAEAGDTGGVADGGLSGDAGAAVTVPRRSPASCNASVTLPRGCPTKLGIRRASGSGGSATSKLIFGAETPLALGGGACDKIRPSGASGNRICAIAPTSKPRRRMLMLAMRWLWPITLGISTRCGPRLSATRTCQPRRTWLPARGTWERIFPSGTMGL